MRTPDFDDPELPLSVLFEHWPEAAPLFFKQRMFCPGCPVSRFYTLADACRRHRVDEAQFRIQIKQRIDDAKRDH